MCGVTNILFIESNNEMYIQQYVRRFKFVVNMGEPMLEIWWGRRLQCIKLVMNHIVIHSQRYYGLMFSMILFSMDIMFNPFLYIEARKIKAHICQMCFVTITTRVNDILSLHPCQYPL